MECRNYHSAFVAFRAYQDDPRYRDLDELNPEQLGDLDDNFEIIRSVMGRARALCAGSDRGSVERAYHDAMLDAALLGDPAAQACFVAGGPQIQTWESSGYSISLRERYLENAPALTQAALERADPHVAWYALFRFVASPPTHPSAYDDMPLPDAFLTWRAARLASLRATPELQSTFERLLAEMAQQEFIGADDIERADAWARARYGQEFAGQPPVDFNNPGPCYPSSWR